ncbi:hypothetical protein N752_29780 [Desulforamulus aquiferis]|nr:hypothetical protein [Desulforamulus aquiferis]RYD01495.1 hypothetical protein N752_29780 [Desulforamulus aquiferis]
MGLRVNIAGKTVEDSNFSVGRSMFVPKPQAPREMKLVPNAKVLDILQKLSMAEALVINNLAQLCGYYRSNIDGLLIKLLNAGLVKYVCVATEHAVFKLWFPTDAKLPRNAQEACRLAMLGTFFSLAAINEIPDFEWRLIRNSKSPVLGEMTFAGMNGKEKWIIDVPRRGEKPQEKANLYIFPTLEEATTQTPNGKKFTSDLFLLKDIGKPLKERIYERAN